LLPTAPVGEIKVTGSNFLTALTRHQKHRPQCQPNHKIAQQLRQAERKQEDFFLEKKTQKTFDFNLGPSERVNDFDPTFCLI
jgi:hypothetical protein